MQLIQFVFIAMVKHIYWSSKSLGFTSKNKDEQLCSGMVGEILGRITKANSQLKLESFQSKSQKSRHKKIPIIFMTGF